MLNMSYILVTEEKRSNSREVSKLSTSNGRGFYRRDDPLWRRSFDPRGSSYTSTGRESAIECHPVVQTCKYKLNVSSAIVVH